MLSGLDNDDLSLSMLGLVEDSICLVSDVNACVDLIVHDATHEGDSPLG